MTENRVSENRILHVEDNPDDVLLTAMAFRKAGADAKLEVATDGDKAIAALSNGTPHRLPVCVLLDIKLPSKSGLEVLAWIRGQPRLKRLPVIMLTSSLIPDDIKRAYDLGANSYLLKPSDLDGLISLAKTIDHYWLRTNTPPPPPG
ncbi:MAG TPA: response regulator [Verrucomicrobiae bacterium]|nr:response regulator [Verrucomicrobiae bacterium]